VSGEPCCRLQRDDQQGGADRGGHGEAAQQRECRHDQEPAARTDQAGDGTHGHTSEQRAGQRMGRDDCCAGAPTAEHRDGGGDHHDREAAQQYRSGQMPTDQAAGERTGHGRGAEHQPGAPLHRAASQMGEQRGE